MILVRRCGVRVLLSEKLDTSQYVEMQPESVNIAYCVKGLARNVSNILVAFGIEGFKQYYLNEIRRTGWRNFVSKVLANLKDHKDAASIGFRVLHSGAGHPLACLEKFLVLLVPPFLKDIAFIHSSTDSVQHEILETRFPINAKLVKIDLKDYFNQGTP